MLSNNSDRSLLYLGLSKLSTEELKEALRTRTFGADQAVDEETFLTITDILHEREGEPSAEKKAAAEKALEEFWAVYADSTPEEELEKLLDAEETKAETSSKRSGKRKYMRRLIAVAAVLCLVSIPVAKANYFNIINVVNRLVGGQFSFSSLDRRADSIDTSQFQKLLDDNGIQFSFRSLWVPEGYSDPQVYDKNYPEFHLIKQELLNADKQLLAFDFKVYREKSFDMIYEEDLDIVEQYNSNSRVFYIIQNTDNVTAATFENNMEFVISGNISVEEMQVIIDSIK